jgi:peroxiredoxin Q/BCP
VSLRESARAIEEFDVVLFMAGVDDLTTNTEFARKNAATFPVLSDADKTVARAYGVLTAGGYAARVTFYIGPDGRIAAVDENVEPLRAGEELLQNLRALGVAGRADSE